MHVFLTGATGLIGGELAGALADRGHAVTALLHRATAIRRNDGTAIHAPRWSEAASAGQVRSVEGSIEHANFGLAPSLVDSLRPKLGAVIHLAAVTDFNVSDARTRAVNVGGTAQAIAFAGGGARPIPLVHGSTAYVCGEVFGLVREGDPPGAGPFDNAYEASKAAAEALVGAAGRDGLPTLIARPSIVVGRHLDGAIGRTSGLYLLLRSIAEGRVRVLPAANGASLDLVPIDHVVRSLVHLTEHVARAAGRIVHLASGQPLPIADLAALGRFYPGLHAPVLMPPDAFDLAALTSEEQLLHRHIVAHFASYLRRGPQFCGATLRALGGPACPETSVAFARRLIDHCIATGFLRAPGQRISG